MSRSKQRWRDRGSAALGTAIFAPVFFLLLGVVVAAGRIQLAQGAADAAARDAARTASLSGSAEGAEAEAREAALASLGSSGLACREVVVTVDSGGLDAQVGQAATVTATVVCTVPLEDVALPGLPGSKTLTGEMTSVVDKWRAR
ncbi:TadE/TadG family type IV pilus assembly protein [Streptomyces sp. MW-W600-10]|uniref:TadE/TadG family type IV pilus assembly protein n=1 Tax=Streptomyces sp. MW-W600-10 TaxID=2829819 RepID=UPI001C47C185|nr:TadE/TadG family type IV pilus assembly protein [Streptomyces sp. MW-W600-10]MBV7249281.1 pilus assembly protein [Streptomyces sp. MW-W600-10]